MRKTLQTLGIGLVALFAAVYISDYNYLLNAIQKIYLTGHTTAYLSDYTRFDNRIIPPSNQPQPWPEHEQFNRFEVSKTLEDYHQQRGTVAFVLIKNDSLLYEKYYEDYGPSSKSNSFSMVKSIVSGLLGKAISDGYIQSVDQAVKDFIPELQGPYSDTVTVGDLATMSSGQLWEENYYGALSVTTESYFTEDLRSLILGQPITEKPADGFNYKSGTTQLLGMVLEKATGKTLSAYFYDSFWHPMGAEKEAYWQLDSDENAMEKAYCCLASNARDFARYGKLIKNHGKWNGKQVLDSAYVALSVRPRFEKDPEYGYGWWLETYKDQKVYMMRGHLGQYVIVFPALDLIAVRLGHRKGEKIDGNPFTEDIYMYMDAAMEMNTNVGETSAE